MASDEDDAYTPREPLTPLYSTASGDAPAPGPRGSRNGPLGARLSQRGRATQPPAVSQETSFAPYMPGVPEADETSQAAGGAYIPASRPSPSWGRVTGLLKLDEKVTGALHADLQFGATWSSRSEMLRACLDEYYRLVASYNEARRLLELSGADIEALRREQTVASARLREVESRLEFHSRTELRAVYLGAAETEARLFRAEEERDLLNSRTELLEGFMAFLSRIIATVRAIPPNVVIGGDAPPDAGANGANGANGVRATPCLPADASPDETLLYVGSRNPRPRDASATISPAPPAGSVGPGAAEASHEIEELLLDEDEVALLASSEFEIIEILDDEPSVTGESGTSEADVATRGATHQPAGEGPGETASEVAAGPGLEGS